LVVAMAVYATAAISLSWLRALNFGTDAWDLGIYQQALWSTAHGRPFWETLDAETGGFGSLLQVHSVFLLYLLVPIYSVAPSEFTLFVVQGLIVTAAAIPLYLLARDVTSSPRWALVAGVVYLAWTPTLAANLYDFHAEAFLPLEIFTVVLLFERRRWGWGLLAATVGCLTFEFAAVLLFFVGVFFALPAPGFVTRCFVRLGRRGGGNGPNADWAPAFRRYLADPKVLAAGALLLLSALAYGLLLVVRHDLLSPWLGISPFPSSTAPYLIGSTPAQLQLGLANLGDGFETKLAYWVLLLALLGLIPLLAPRALVLSIPWFAFTMLSAGTGYVTLGYQYGFIAGSSLLVAFAYGLVPVSQWYGARERSMASAAPGPPAGRTAPSVRRATLVAGIALLIAVNVALGPANPALDGQPLGSAYLVSYDPPGGYHQVEELADVIPAGAPVLASDNVFPFVADDVNAYALAWVEDNFLNLPFNATHPPSYVLLSADRTTPVPGWLAEAIYEPKVFGVRGAVWSTPVGPVLLFETSYAGPTEYFGPTVGPDGAYVGDALDPGSAGYATDLPLAPNAPIVESDPGAAGPLFGPISFDLPPGNYSFTFSVRSFAEYPANPPPPNSTVFFVGATSWASGAAFSASYSFAQLDASGWTTLMFPVTATDPVLGLSVEAFTDTPSAVVEVAGLGISSSS
jgi:uncharacterized membrane protein